MPKQRWPEEVSKEIRVKGDVQLQEKLVSEKLLRVPGCRSGLLSTVRVCGVQEPVRAQTNGKEEEEAE